MKAIGKIICSYIDKTIHKQYYVTIYKEYSTLDDFVEFYRKLQHEFEAIKTFSPWVLKTDEIQDNYELIDVVEGIILSDGDKLPHADYYVKTYFVPSKTT